MVGRSAFVALAVWISPGMVCLAAQLSFPIWRGSNVLLAGEWDASPIVAVGEVTNVREYGEQFVRTLPWPMSPEVHKLFWCQADFEVKAVVKGRLGSTSRRYLWAAPQPGCPLTYGDDRISSRFRTRVWFLREEGRFLRPTFDGGTSWFLGLFARWEESPVLPARRRLGEFLLTPSAVSDTNKDYAAALWSVGDIACELLGEQGCAQRIRQLAKLGEPALREAACGFLEGQLREGCGSN